jgi:hypothetical protein
MQLGKGNVRKGDAFLYSGEYRLSLFENVEAKFTIYHTDDNWVLYEVVASVQSHEE